MNPIKEKTQQALEVIEPLSELEPCGANLEYDPEYVVLVAKMTPKSDTQYGDFIGTAEVPSWPEIERDCRRMLLRSCDITILIMLLRCRTRTAQAAGLREGLALLVASLEQYPNEIHPQATIEGELDLTVRANALATLTDPEGLMADIREIIINKNSAMRLQVRDVERAFSAPRPPDALSVSSVRQQLDDLYRQHDNNLSALVDVTDLVARLQAWSIQHLGEHAPDLSCFTKLISLFVRQDQPQADSASVTKTTSKKKGSVSSAAIEPVDQPSPPSPFFMPISNLDLDVDAIQNREKALRTMIKTREWFEQNEPSSPVAVLLRQAEKLVGKRFSEVAQCIPLELLERWEQGGANS